MKVLRRVLIVSFFAVLIVTVYIRLSSKSASDIEAQYDDSVVGQILAVDMELNYPANPREVVVYYSRIIKALYSEDYTEDQLVGLAQHARALFDEELLGYNDYDSYLERLKLDVDTYKAANKYITQYIVERASDNEMIIDDGIQYARVKVIYYTSESSSTRSKVYEQYTLRQDEDSKWKILFWEVIPETTVKGE